MPKNTVKLKKLFSYKALNDQDQRLCRLHFRQKLDERHLRNKYWKRTDEIYKRTVAFSQNDADCFLSFDDALVGEHFKVLVVLLNGITVRYNYVLYCSVIDLRLIDNEALPDFYCDVLINLLTCELTRLPHMTLKFIMYRDTFACSRALRVMRKSPGTKEFYKRYTFMPDPLGLKTAFSFNKYAQTAINDVLYGTLSWENLESVFERHRLKLHDKPQLAEVLDFITDFERLSDDLLSYRNEISMCNCTLRTLDLFFYGMRVHMQDADEEVVNRALIFSYLRALIIIFDL